MHRSSWGLASAGALEALRALFAGMPPTLGAAFVVVVHQSAEHASQLADLLRPYTTFCVRQGRVDETLALEPDSIVVVPANCRLVVGDTQMTLAPLRQGSGQGARIDQLFRSLAAVCNTRGVAVVLTGAGSDGSLGVRRVKDAGGLVIVQDPEEAEHAGMARNAIETGTVDLILPLREIAPALARYCRAQPQMPQRQDDRSADPLEVQELLALLEGRTGRDLAVFKRSLIERRVAKRMRVRAIDSFHAYLRLLGTDAGEVNELADDVLLNVTEFFEHGATRERLVTEVLPRFFDRKTGEQDTLRVWCVGCSTGEEAYSIAMELVEEQERRGERLPRVQVFASDPSGERLERARLGFYPPEIAEFVSSERLDRFFVREQRGFKVRPELRRLVVFAAQDVFKDFPFSHLDLIYCRQRLLDGATAEARGALLQSFHFALKEHGLLVVDPQATIDEPQLFLPVGHGSMVFKRAEGARRRLNIPLRPGSFFATQATRQDAPISSAARALHVTLIERYMPASMLIDASHQVVHYSTQAARFVRMPGGRPTHDVLKIVGEPLKTVLRTGLAAVEERAAKWTSESVIVHAPGGARRVIVHIDAVGPEVPAAGFKLVVFEEDGWPAGRRIATPQRSPVDFTSLLGAELAETTERLKKVVARDSAITEREARADHADIARVVEDLESAKEELQTVNEELYALNLENTTRLEELARVSMDLEVLLESTGVATLFLDAELNVVRFTSPVRDVFNLLPDDRGRPLADLNHRLRDDGLLDDVRSVLRHLTPMDREVQGEDGRWYLLRILPYRTTPQDVAGVAITLVDITSRRKAEQRLREADRRKDEFIALLAHELRNPLAPISSGIELLKRRDLEPAVAERITLTMGRQAAQLVRLIDDLLDVSRISSGRLRLRKGTVAVADVVRDAVAGVRPMVDRSGHTLTVTMPSEPILLDADAARLTQVIANLLNNAARYTPGGGNIDLTTRLDGNEVLIAVKDTVAVVVNGELGGHRVLVVDDNADAANTLAMLIRTLGENEVHVALSGAEALPLAERVKPDTIFLDLKMPEMDGFEVAQRLRAEPWANDAMLVALTGWALDEHKRRTKEAGFDQHLTKPADISALQSILGRREASRLS